ncbi:MAG: hypothetical protein ABIP74_01960 [Candidatus Saccharimonas sp.]
MYLFMRETFDIPPQTDNPPDELSYPQQLLRRHRARIEADIERLDREHNELVRHTREHGTWKDKLMILGEHAWYYTQRSKLDFALMEVERQEKSDATRYTYIAPVEPLDIDR